MNYQNLYLNSLSLSTIPYCDFLEAYIFRDPVSGSNIYFPASAFGGFFNSGNLLVGGEQFFGSGIWNNVGTSITPNITSIPLVPDFYLDTMVGSRIQDFDITPHYLSQNTDIGIISSGETYTFSCFVCGNSRQYFGLYVSGVGSNRVGALYDVFNGTVQSNGANGTGYSVVNASISALKDKWYWCNLAFTAGATVPHSIFLVHRRTSWGGPTVEMLEPYSSITFPGYSFIWGAQLRKGGFTTSTNVYPYIEYPSYLNSISGGPLADTCYEDYCYKITTLNPIKLYCVSTVNFILSGINQDDSRVVKIIYDFNDGSLPLQVSLKKENNIQVSPLTQQISRVYYPKNNTVATTYNPTISVIRNDCCVNTFNLTLCSFKCSILETYEDVILHNAQQSNNYNVVLTLEKQSERQFFKNALDLSNIIFALPTESRLPNLVEPIPPEINVPNPRPLDRLPPSLPVQASPITLPERFYDYLEGEGINLSPDYLQIVPSDEIMSDLNSGLTLSGDGPPYLQDEGIDIRYT